MVPSLFLQSSHLLSKQALLLKLIGDLYIQAFLEAMNTFSCSLPSSCCSSSSSSFSHPFLPSLPSLAAAPRRYRRAALARRCPRSTVLAASRRDDADSGGRLVDEDMIVLRKRLHEMQAAERNYEPPSHWMEWEKRCYASYDADVCHFVGLVQAFLMSTRPSVALGVLALVTLSVPTSAAVVVLNLVAAMKAVLAGLHVG